MIDPNNFPSSTDVRLGCTGGVTRRLAWLITHWLNYSFILPIDSLLVDLLVPLFVGGVPDGLPDDSLGGLLGGFTISP